MATKKTEQYSQGEKIRFQLLAFLNSSEALYLLETAILRNEDSFLNSTLSLEVRERLGGKIRIRMRNNSIDGFREAEKEYKL